MFEKIRKPGRAKSLFSYMVFGLICLVFVFIGVPMGQMSDLGGAALVVNNRVISWSEYRNYLDNLERQSQASGDTELEAERQKRLKSRALEDLLSVELITQEASKMGEVVATKAIQSKIVTSPAFQEEGRFKHSNYHAFLSARRFSPAKFEKLIAKEIQTARFQKLFDLAVYSAKAEKQKKEELRSFDIGVSYISFSGTELSADELNQLEATVKKGDNGLKQIIQSKKWSWKKTKSFNLESTFIPGLELQKILFEEVLNHLPQTGLVNKVIGARDKFFLLRVDKFARIKTDTSPSITSNFFMDKMQGRMTFLSWINFARSGASLRVNPRLQNTSE